MVPNHRLKPVFTRSFRRINKNSINTGWHNASFRAYADYMQTPAFFSGLNALNNLIKAKRNVVIMCVEVSSLALSSIVDC
jgi:hypothetical protein